MKTWERWPMAVLGVVMLGILSSCSTVYGVREEDWNRMSLAEQNATIAAYNKRQIIIEQQKQLERERAHEAAHQAALKAELEAQRQRERARAIRDGLIGVHGDLVRVTIQGGEMRIGTDVRTYQPMSFLIADGETRHVAFVGEGKYSEYDTSVPFSYTNGQLTFDSGPAARKFFYDKGWDRGKQYDHVFLESHSTSFAKDVSVKIQIVETESSRRRGRR